MRMLVKLASAHSSTTGHPLSEVRYQGIDSLRRAVLRVEESVLDFVTCSKMSKNITKSSFSLDKIDEDTKEENDDDTELFASLPKIRDSAVYRPYFEALKSFEKEVEYTSSTKKSEEEEEASPLAKSLSEMLKVEVGICETVLKYTNNDMNEAGMLIVSSMDNLSGLVESLTEQNYNNDDNDNDDDDDGSSMMNLLINFKTTE